MPSILKMTRHGKTTMQREYLLGWLMQDILKKNVIGQPVMLSGSRYSVRVLSRIAGKLVERLHKNGFNIVVGDNPNGIDNSVIQSALLQKVRTLVVGCQQAPRGSWTSTVDVEYSYFQSPIQQVPHKYYERDEFLVNLAGSGFFLWNGHSTGTVRAYDYMASVNKPCYLIMLDHEAYDGKLITVFTDGNRPIGKGIHAKD